MNLVLDIGNTNAKAAIFDRDKLIEKSTVLKRYIRRNTEKLLSRYQINQAIVSSTASDDLSLTEVLSKLKKCIWLDHNTGLPVSNLYHTPVTLGKDRLAAAVGASKLFPASNCLIIDMGSCITMDFLTKKGEFIGGNISPGITMRCKAMHKFTAKLPLVKIDLPQEDFGLNTVNALQNGAVKGTFREIDAFIKETKDKQGLINVILTGGDAGLFESWTKNKIFVVPNLVLEGLNEILKYNVEKI